MEIIYSFTSMERIKKALRLFVLIILIVLASLGVGISGGVPIPTIKRKEDAIQIKVESKKTAQDDKTALNLLEIK